MMNTNGKPSYHLTLCLVNYNGERYLEESLKSVFIQKERFEEILLIDNTSEDRSLEIVRNQFPAVRVVQLDKNRGPAMARNIGFKVASCDLILFMDNDVSLARDYSDRLIQAWNDHPRAAVAMPCSHCYAASSLRKQQRYHPI
jgi:GT2 family glycosyltransferase